MLTQRILKIQFFLFCILTCFPLFKLIYTSILIGAFVLLSLIIGLIEYDKIQKKLLKELIIFTSPFLIVFISIIFFDRSSSGYFYLEKSLSLFLFPFAFFILPIKFSKEQKKIFSILFIFSTLIIVILGLTGTIIEFSSHLGPNKHYSTSSQIFKDPTFSFHVRYFFEKSSNMHPTYASLFLGISFIIVLENYLRDYYTSTKFQEICHLLILFFILVLQIILAARTPIFGTIIAALILIFLFLKRKIYALWIGIGFVALAGILIVLTPSFSARLKEISINNIALPNATNFDSFNIRTGIYQCSLTLVKNNWVFGVGPGKVQENLNSCYGAFAKEVYGGENYNTHNQFLDYWAGMGFIAPCILLILLIYSIIVNFKSREYLASCLCVLFFICMQTENILLRHNGVVVFSYCMSLYCFAQTNKTEMFFINKRKRI